MPDMNTLTGRRIFVRAFDQQDKPIATLFQGPWLLASAGLTSGKTMTSWPGIRDDMVNAGATWLDQEVVRDGNWMTSRGPQDMVPFVSAMTKLFSGAAAGAQGAAQHAGSDPQRAQPHALVVNAMRWLPRPSFRTILGMALLGAGLAAAGRRRVGHRMSQTPRHHRLGRA